MRGLNLVQLRIRPEKYISSQNFTQLTTALDGFIHKGSIDGLYVHQTRLLSKYHYLVDHQPPQPIALSNCRQHSWLGYYIVSAGEKGLLSRVEEWVTGKEEGRKQPRAIAQHALELRLSRFIGNGMHEDVDLTNYTGHPVQFSLRLELDADFVDQRESHKKRHKIHGTLTRQWSEDKTELVFDYQAEHKYRNQGETGTAHLHRGVIVRIRNAGSPPVYDNQGITFSIALDPKASWHACVQVIPVLDGQPAEPVYGCRSFFGASASAFDSKRQAFLKEATMLAVPGSDTLAPVVAQAFQRAKEDLAALRLYDLDEDLHSWLPAAGVPTYIGLFGRDVLFTAQSASLVSTDLMRGSLTKLAEQQGQRVDAWRDEQPGRILHQSQLGPLEVLNYNPFARYYGEITSPAFFGVLLANLWHWTGDRSLVLPLLEPAMKALQWLDEYAQLKGDGFYWFEKRSKKGLKNQGWMDSGQSILYPDGSEVPDPIAACDVQGFVYQAKVSLAETLSWLGEEDRAERYLREAQELKDRFNEKFWMEDEHLLAAGLDPQQRQIRSCISNSGILLTTGIVDEQRVPLIAERLFRPDLFSGWGIRTLSSDHPAYNPFSYQRGAVWPFEQAMTVRGFMLQDLFEPMHKLCRAQFEAATLFQFDRLPECFCGHPRDDAHPFPGLYPAANWPQAWSSAGIFTLVEALLGVYPYAALHTLVLDPHLPEWLPEITLTNLRVGSGVAALRFSRHEDGSTGFEVLDVEGNLDVIHEPSPWKWAEQFGGRIKEAMEHRLGASSQVGS